MLPASCDVAIVGAGPAGAATALGLHRLAPNLSVALLDAGVRQRPLIEEALGSEARPVLEQLGLWEAFLATEPRASQGIRAAWGRSDLDARPSLFSRSGWRIRRPPLVDSFLAESQRRGAAIARETRMLEVNARDGGGWDLALEARGEPRELTARFVVDATGRRAAVARRLGARKVRFDRLVAAIAVASTPAADLDADALVEARELGFWYVAPCSDEAIMAAIVTDADLAREHRLGDEAVWLASLEASAVGRYRHERWADRPFGPPSIRALDCHSLDLVADDAGWLAVGAAAAHPDFLASHGLVHALRTGAWAAVAITGYLAGRTAGLRRYQAHVGRWLETHLESRRATYGAEKRWPDAPFWARRHDRDHLNPDQLLSFSESDANRIRLEGLGMHLPVDQLHLLCSLCVAPRLTHAVVRAFRERYRSPGPPPPEWRILAALRFLVDQGLVTAE